MDVRLPDGTVIKNVPDGMTKAQLVEKLSANGHDTSWYKPEPTAAPASFMGRFKDEAMTSLPGGVVRGVKDVVDTLAGFAARAGGADEAARVQAENDAGKAEFAAAQSRAGAGGSNVARVGGQVLATAPVGPILGAGAKALGATRLGNALSSSGFTTGAPAASTLAGKVGDMALRMGGGGVTGGASAGLVDPEFAGTGAAVGAVLPPALKGLGQTFGAAGRAISGPAVPDGVRKGAQLAKEAGYVLPPTQAKPNLGNRLMEGMAGKISTAQNASARNQEVTNRLAKQALGLADDAPLNMESLAGVRNQAADAYRELKTLGNLRGDKQFNSQMAGLKGAYEGAAKDFPELANPELSRVLDSLKQSQFKASSAVDAIRILREKADKAFATGDKGTAKALRQASGAMEELIERNLVRMNSEASLNALLRSGGMKGGNFTQDVLATAVTNPASQMLRNFRNARQMIAKTYSVEKALNPASGNIEASKLAGLLKRQKPLSGELKTIAEVASQFPKAMQPVERMGSLPQLSPLDWIGSGALSAATGNPLLMTGIAARPAMRALALSPRVQAGLGTESAPGAITGLLGDPAALRLGYRAAPLLSSSR